MSDSVRERLRACWSRSDEIFYLLEDGAIHEQPIGLRHPLIFYLGHLPAFAWNQVCRGVLGMAAFRPDFDTLFERGIDPMEVDHFDSPTEWPPVEDVIEYRDQVRWALMDSVDSVIDRAENNLLADRGRIFEVAIEHELMHQETLQYLFQQLPQQMKRRPAEMPSYRFDGAARPGAIEIGGGPVLLGADFDSVPFGWDNEFPAHQTTVEDFSIDRTPVRNSEFLEFLMDGCY